MNGADIVEVSLENNNDKNDCFWGKIEENVERLLIWVKFSFKFEELLKMLLIGVNSPACSVKIVEPIYPIEVIITKTP
jgi:hypothetical protein